MCWPPPPPPASATPSSSTKRSSRSIPRPSSPATLSASASTPATRSAAYEVGRIARERGAWVVYGGIHATLYSRKKPLQLGGAHAVVKGDGDVDLGPSPHRLRQLALLRATLRRRTHRRRSVPAARWDLHAPRQSTCGPPYRPSAAARSTAPSAPSGALTARSRASAPSDVRHPRNRQLPPHRLPLHRSRRRQFLPRHPHRSRASRAKQKIMPARRAQTPSAPSASSSWPPRQAPQRHGLLHPDHHGSRRRHRVPRRHAQSPHQRRAGRRRSRHRRRP